jgi:tRNA splicing endonuclease
MLMLCGGQEGSNYMFKKLTALTLVAAFAAGAFVVVAPNQVLAAESKTTTKTETKKDPYAYTAKSGDSYTVLARKAVQTYGIREKVKLSQAQIVAAETFLTSDAGFPELNEGDAVSFKPETVAAAMKKSQTQTEAQLAQWQTYVPYVDFDTRDNG